MLNIICFADGNVVACVDVLQITHAAISLVNSCLRCIYKVYSEFIAYAEGYIQDSGYDVCLFLGDN